MNDKAKSLPAVSGGEAGVYYVVVREDGSAEVAPVNAVPLGMAGEVGRAVMEHGRSKPEPGTVRITSVHEEKLLSLLFEKAPASEAEAAGLRRGLTLAKAASRLARSARDRLRDGLFAVLRADTLSEAHGAARSGLSRAEQPTEALDRQEPRALTILRGVMQAIADGPRHGCDAAAMAGHALDRVAMLERNLLPPTELELIDQQPALEKARAVVYADDTRRREVEAKFRAIGDTAVAMATGVVEVLARGMLERGLRGKDVELPRGARREHLIVLALAPSNPREWQALWLADVRSGQIGENNVSRGLAEKPRPLDTIMFAFAKQAQASDPIAALRLLHNEVMR